MNMHSNKKENNNTETVETPTNRLDGAIIKYFKTQKEVADLIGITPANLNNYLTNRATITQKLAMRIQDATGISAKYVLKGEGEIMLDKHRKPIFEGEVPFVTKVDTKTQHGITKQFILQYEGNQKILKPNGEGSVIDLVLGSLEDTSISFQIFNTLPEFEEDYGIPITATIILKKNYKDNDLVLYIINDECEMGVYYQGQITELKTKRVYAAETTEIKGRVIGKFENIRYKKIK